jgi:hypothetical protein
MVTHARVLLDGADPGGFNPSVGILDGHTNRNGRAQLLAVLVSIPQSGFLMVTHRRASWRPRRTGCFNPSVGILDGHTGQLIGHIIPLNCFNPSVGILDGHTIDT